MYFIMKKKNLLFIIMSFDILVKLISMAALVKINVETIFQLHLSGWNKYIFTWNSENDGAIKPGVIAFLTNCYLLSNLAGNVA